MMAGCTAYMLETPAQIKERLKASQSILIALPKHWDGDSLASAIALAWHLEKDGKNATIVADGLVFPKNLRFLKPDDKLFLGALRQLRKFIITVDMARAKLGEFSYSVEGDKMHIYLTPEDGMFEASDVHTASAGFRYDCLIVLGAPDLVSLGAPFETQAEFFYAVPIINIDHHANNDNFGQINHVDVVSATTAEVVYFLLKDTLDAMIDERMATALLTGVIAGTKSFRSATITPRCLEVVSDLIHRGAERETIMQHLYRARSIRTLKLWGRVLTHIEESPEHKLLWSTITADDFAATGATPEESIEVIDELLTTMADPKVQVLFSERARDPESICDVMVNAEHGADARVLLKPWNPQGSTERAMASIRGLSLEQTTREVVEYIKKALPPTPSKK